MVQPFHPFQAQNATLCSCTQLSGFRADQWAAASVARGVDLRLLLALSFAD
jgi:hypothetical protein